jgi:hypothetical protein
MQENFFAFVCLKKAEAFLGVIPFHFACRHGVLLALVALFGSRKTIALVKGR